MSKKIYFICCCVSLILLNGLVTAHAETRPVKFSKQCLIIDMNEGCAIADVNRDGKPDIIAGEHWYAAPDFIPRPVRQIFPLNDLQPYINGEVLQNAGDLPYDVDGDGWMDVISVGWTEKEICWYRNPGNYDEHCWTRHILGAVAGENEALALRDFDGDGIPEIYVNCWNKKKPQVIYRMTRDENSRPALQQIVIGEAGGHGYAFGDINGDGKEDILCESGWYEQPDKDIFSQPWKLHRETALPHPSNPFVVAKLTDSGRNDIIWSKAHDYGIYWWEQGEPGADGTTTWTEHLIDKSWSVAHGLVWTDIDRDGQPELIAGKRVRAHVNKDPGSSEPECLFYYKWNTKKREFTRYAISAPGEGVGMGVQISVSDLNDDKLPDIVVAGKTGTYILWNKGKR